MSNPMFSQSSPEHKPAELRAHEWLAVVIIIGVVGSLAIITSWQGKKSSLSLPWTKQEDRIEVLIKGAVAYPGIYTIPTNLDMGTILQLAGVKGDADLRRLKKDSVVKKSRVVNVPARQMISVYVEGAVKSPRKIVVPKGTKVEDLLQRVEFEEGADKKILQKKRKLKDNEKLVVKKKNTSSQ